MNWDNKHVFDLLRFQMRTSYFFIDLYIFYVTNLSEKELIALNIGNKGNWTEHDNQLFSYYKNHLRKELQVEKLSYFKSKENIHNS